jgi:hypothetical protein
MRKVIGFTLLAGILFGFAIDYLRKPSKQTQATSVAEKNDEYVEHKDHEVVSEMCGNYDGVSPLEKELIRRLENVDGWTKTKDDTWRNTYAYGDVCLKWTYFNDRTSNNDAWIDIKGQPPLHTMLNDDEYKRVYKKAAALCVIFYKIGCKQEQIERKKRGEEAARKLKEQP